MLHTSSNFNLGAMEIVILTIVGFFLLRAVTRRKNGSSDSVLRALGVTAAILVAVFMAAVMMYGSSQRAVRVESVTAQAVSSSSSKTRVFTMANRPSLIHGEVDLTAPDTTTARAQTTATPADSEMLMLPLSNQVLVELIGAEGARAIEDLNASVPPELRQAYAMIPILGPGQSAVGPVLRDTVGPAIEHGLGDDGLKKLESAVSELIAAAKTRHLLTAEAAEQEEYVAPDWVNNPADGYIVVESEFAELSTDSKDNLRPAIEEALQERVSELVSKQFGTDGGWARLMNVSVTDAAIDDCIVETSERTTVIETSVGGVPMRRTYALVNLPDTLQDDLAKEVRKSLQHNRMTAVCITVGILWLCAMLLSVVFRAGQSQSILRKLATVPMIGLLVIPCVVMFVAMTGAMLNGETFDFEWSKDRVACVIDRTVE